MIFSFARGQTTFYSLSEKQDSTANDSAFYSWLNNQLPYDDGNDGLQNKYSLASNSINPFRQTINLYAATNVRLRGYADNLNTTIINGFVAENLSDGKTNFNLLSALRGVAKVKNVSFGLQSDTTLLAIFSGVGNNSYNTIYPSNFSKRINIRYSSSSTTYTNSIAMVYHTGVLKHNWALSLSGDIQYTHQGYVSGTYGSIANFLIAIGKTITSKQRYTMLACIAPTSNAMRGSSVQEMFALAQTNYYNPNWGYQSGKQRSDAIRSNVQPYFILSHEYMPSTKSVLQTTLAYSFGEQSNSSLDWYRAPNPHPDYYKYLPSYQTTIADKNAVTYAMQENENVRQINWDNMYDINRNADSMPSVAGKRAHYIVASNVNAIKQFQANVAFTNSLKQNVQYNIGANFQMEYNNAYKRVEDLLGANYFVNINQYAEIQYPLNNNAMQYDLNNPNGIIRTKGKYNFNYGMNISTTKLWTQWLASFRHIYFFAAIHMSYTQLFREGYMKNGIFSTTSFGKSSTHFFFNYNTKTGVAYHFNEKNILSLNASYGTKNPTFQNIYVSPKTRNDVQTTLPNETIFDLELNYTHYNNVFNFSFNAFYSSFQNGLQTVSYYDDDINTFVNYALHNIGQIAYGIELGAIWKWSPKLTINAAASVGQYYYNTRQYATITSDNDVAVLNNETCYVKNFVVPNTPQQIWCSGIQYRLSKQFSIGINGMYCNDIWMGYNPIRRTIRATQTIINQGLRDSILNQTKLPKRFTMNMTMNYSCHFSVFQKSKSTTLNVRLLVNNLLNTQNNIAVANEQLRFDFTSFNVNKFAPTYTYAYGLNYLLSLNFTL